MNIFILDLSPKKAAESLCNKHLSKMPLETTQMAYTCHHVLDGSCSNIGAYKKTHENHPCNVWARTSLTNYIWLVEHGIYICKEYNKEYNKTHKCKDHLLWLYNNPPKNIKDIGLTPFAMAFYGTDIVKHNQCLVPGDPVQSYRNYYKEDKKEFAKWKNRPTPNWWE